MARFRCFLVITAALGWMFPSLAGAQTLHRWQSIATGEALELRVMPLQAANPGAASPVIIYLLNLPAPRVGTESDDVLIAEAVAAGYGVVTLDYKLNPKARVPHINRDLGKIRDELRAGAFPLPYPFDPAHVYIVPSGHRLLRDVAYFKTPQRTFAFDLIYPSKPARPVGTVLEFSCDNKDRMGNTSLSICSDTILDGQATEGFAVAMADHPVEAPYKGLDAMPDCGVKIKAAVRTLRATAGTLGLNSHIAPVGFSRGSGMALMLVTTAGMKEFEGHGEHVEQDSSAQGAVVMSGRFTYLDLLSNDHMLPRYAKAWGERGTHLDTWTRHGALDYLQGPTVPLFLTINCTESPDALHQMKVLRRRLAEFGSDDIFMMDREARGHKVTLVPEILEAMNEYLKRQLK